ncbi:hypothetical protein CRUP_000726, partial [Coryphaenoides rupestris]
MASLAGGEGPRGHHAPPHSVEAVAPTDLNVTATELADWLLLITQMLKSNIVTVGDTEEIRATIRRLQELGRGQASVAGFSELSAQLLREASDRQAHLDCELKGLQASLRELEAFLKWLQEAETTVNAEIDAHNDIYRSVEANKSKMVKALGSSEEAVFLQHRLDDMNQRWSDLKAKSANIRAHLEASAERWSRLLGLLEELWRWICAKDDDLAKQMPIGGDVPTLLQQQNHCT